jgi:hypothetical protein
MGTGCLLPKQSPKSNSVPIYYSIGTVQNNKKEEMRYVNQASKEKSKGSREQGAARLYCQSHAIPRQPQLQNWRGVEAKYPFQP